MKLLITDHLELNSQGNNLKKSNKIKRIHECPNCRHIYASDNKKRFPDYCRCGHQFFLQETAFKKWSNRPYCLVELTSVGWESLNQSIMALLRAGQFCITWFEYLKNRDHL
jgi:hypothetical protein